jgi:N-acetylmuramate 1-kinase
MEDSRKTQLENWTRQQLRQLLSDQTIEIELSTVSGDASFRRYFRAQNLQQSYIAVDSPPENENSELFVEIAGYFRSAGVLAPKVYAQNFELGFLLLEDFGDQLYLRSLLKLQTKAADSESQLLLEKYYQDAIHALIKIQTKVDKNRLAPYDRKKLRTEMELFESWFCEQYLSLELTAEERALINSCFAFLEDAALSQTQLAVHRDYHSRNLLIVDASRFAGISGPAIIDFQDAMAGAYSYDLVSLLRDCYIRLRPELVKKLALYYFDAATAHGLIADISATQFLRDLDLIGLQRNFKVMGIFSRLCIRDKKPQYLADIPLVIRYFLEVACKYEEMAPFLDWFETRVLPIAKTKLNLEF